MEANESKPTRFRWRPVVCILVILVLAEPAAIAALAVVYVKEVNKKTEDELVQGEEPVCDDVAIVGAGVGGTYAAWRLRDRQRSVTVYEISDRVGGRMHTVHIDGIPDINVELGAMRFLPAAHYLMNTTAIALGLSVVPFLEGMGVEGGTMMYERGKHFSRERLVADGPYDVPEQYRHLDAIHLKRYLFLNKTDFDVNRNYSLEGLLHVKTEDGLELYRQSATRAFTTMGVSKELQTIFCLDFKSFCDDIVAALVVPVIQDPDVPRVMEVSTIGEGMQSLPEGMLKAFLKKSNRHQVKMQMALQKISKNQNNAMDLELLDMKTGSIITSCARNVVLAMPRSALKRIDWSGFKKDDIADILDNACRDSPAAKVFLAYDDPWWRKVQLKSNHTVTELPNRQTYDFGTSNVSNKSILLAAYTDMGDVKLWRELQYTQPPSKCSAESATCLNEAVIDVAQKFLAEIYNIKADDIPKPTGGAISLWDKYPFGAAWHNWRPGYIWNEVHTKMLQPVPDENVFVPTGMYYPAIADSWGETALESVDKILDRLKL